MTAAGLVTAALLALLLLYRELAATLRPSAAGAESQLVQAGGWTLLGAFLALTAVRLAGYL